MRSRDTEWTPRKLMQMMVLGSRQAPIVGSPSRVADEMQAWVDEADVDGFNLSRTVSPNASRTSWPSSCRNCSRAG